MKELLPNRHLILHDHEEPLHSEENVIKVTYRTNTSIVTAETFIFRHKKGNLPYHVKSRFAFVSNRTYIVNMVNV